jgi:hypothetical protein
VWFEVGAINSINAVKEEKASLDVAFKLNSLDAIRRYSTRHFPLKSLSREDSSAQEY